MKIYVLKIYGSECAFFSNKKKALKAGWKNAEPMHEGWQGKYHFYSYEFQIEEWIEGKDTQFARSWTYEREYEILPWDKEGKLIPLVRIKK